MPSTLLPETLFAVQRIFPRLGRVCTVVDVLAAWAGDATSAPAD
jgi:hypothetical protein